MQALIDCTRWKSSMSGVATDRHIDAPPRDSSDRLLWRVPEQPRRDDFMGDHAFYVNPA
jgi:hypothetical protein